MRSKKTISENEHDVKIESLDRFSKHNATSTRDVIRQPLTDRYWAEDTVTFLR